MHLTWLAILFLSIGWHFLTPIYATNYRWGVSLVLLGTVLNAIAMADIRLKKMANRTLATLCMVPIVSIMLVPFPYDLGFWVIAAGLLLLMLPLDLKRLAAASAGVLLSGVILVIQLAILPLYFKLASRSVAIPGLSASASGMLRFFGCDCTSTPHVLTVATADQILHFGCDAGKLGLYPWLNLTAAAFITALVAAPGKKRFWLIFIVLSACLYGLFRYVALILFYMTTENISLFWNPWVALISFLPLVAFFSQTVPLSNDTIEDHGQIGNVDKRSVGLTLVGIVCVVSAVGFHDPGTIKRGRVVIDEKHSNWEWTTRAYDTQWYGKKSGYNYYCLADYLSHFFNVTRNTAVITAEGLSDCDVLIVKTPTSTFLEREVDAIRKFVRRGGGLFLVGDHTNVFGTSAYINPIAEQFGMRFNYDATYDLHTGSLSVYQRPTLLPHPVVQHLPVFLFGSSCTLDAPLGAEDVIVGYQLRSLQLDYARKNFFPENIHDPAMRIGLFLQCAAIKHFRGRVLAFTDSTVFSNFWLHMPGKSELLLSAMNWLNRSNRFPDNLKSGLFFLGIVLAGIGFTRLLGQRRPADATCVFLIAAIICAPIMAVMFQTMNRHIYRMPIAHTPVTLIDFDSEHSAIRLPVSALVDNPDTSYETFFVWTQRLGYVPRLTSRLSEGLRQNGTLFVINANQPFSDSQKTAVINYVNGGGRLIVMDSAFNANSTSNQVLSLFDMKLSFGPRKRAVFFDPWGARLSTTPFAARVSGGQAVLSTMDKEAILAQKQSGVGMVVVIADAMLFADRTYGTTGVVPTDEQRRLYDIQFWLLRELIQHRRLTLHSGDAFHVPVHTLPLKSAS